MRNRVIIMAMILLVLDRALKLSAQQGLTEGRSFFGFYPRITLHKNYGLAFDLPIARLALIIVIVIILIGFMLWIIRAWQTAPRTRNALAFVVIGATSNLFDRIVFGFVIDTIEIFPRSVWNVADIMIVLGLLMLMRTYGQSKIRSALRS